MNAPFIVCFVLCIGFGIAALYFNHLDRMDAAEDYHLMHGPNSGCADCESK